MTPNTNGLADNTIYHSLSNVVVKIQAANSTDADGQSLLVNAHFDSVMGSPGCLLFIFKAFPIFLK